MGRHTQRSGKRIWCDKSVTSLYDTDFLKKLFPDAKFVVLYRHCMDFIHSALEVARYGWEEIGIKVNDSANHVDSLAHFWEIETSKLLDFHEEYSEQTHILCYERLVTEPQHVLPQLFEFLGLEFPDNIIEATFSNDHQFGAGDAKVQFTTGIETENLGKGRFVPRDKIERTTERKVNALLGQLDYETIDAHWNSRSLPMAARIDQPGSEEAKVVGQELERLFGQMLPIRLSAFSQNGSRQARTVKLSILDCTDQSYILDFHSGKCMAVAADEPADTSLSFRYSTLREIIEGKTNPGKAVSDGKIIMSGDVEAAGLVPQLFEH